MNKPKFYSTWLLLAGSLPRGIVAFVVAIVGLSVGLPLAVFVIGLPLFAGMLLALERMLGLERRLVAGGGPGNGERMAAELQGLAAIREDERLKGWRGWINILGDANRYRGLAYGIGHFPVSILTFVLAIVIPATGIGLLLSPVAHLISFNLFSFDLFEKDWFMNWLFPEWSSFQRSWFNAGLGAILLFGTPFLLRKIAGGYAAWIRWISGSPVYAKSEPA